MLKFKATGANGQPIVGFGLSGKNIEKLKEGKPISFNLNQLGLPSMEVFIWYGKDEATLKKQLINEGIVITKTDLT